MHILIFKYRLILLQTILLSQLYLQFLQITVIPTTSSPSQQDSMLIRFSRIVI